MGNSLTLIKGLAVVGVSYAVVACSSSGGEGSESGETTATEASFAAANKVYITEAQLEDLAPYISTCHGKKRCVTICHRPPGNPTNSKTMTLPLQAMMAHFNHGGPHAEKDYVGTCQRGDSGGSGDDTGTTGDGTTGGDTGGSTGGDDTGTGGDIVVDDGWTDPVPTWCQPYITIDSDCDGVVDATGEPLL